MAPHDETDQKLSLNDSSVAGQVGGIANGNINQAQGEGAIVLSGDGHQATVDQSRHHTIINYYYREEIKPLTEQSDAVVDDLPCPYRGLFHFGPNDAEFFFGREVFVKELLVAVEQRAFVPVLGASGSGKSSVVLAGLVPHLQQIGHWHFTHFRPGNDPFYSLALALVPLLTPELNEIGKISESRQLATELQTGNVRLTDIVTAIQHRYVGDRILLIADQFEELYTLGTKDATRRQFLDCLLTSLPVKPAHGISPLVLVATMRADFLGNALSHRPFADMLQRGDVKLGAMNSDELTQVIEKPAQKLGVEFEGGLVHRILEDVKSEPGNLPLLEFALTELWKRRDGKYLTHQAYEDIGKVEGALARHADEQFKILSAQDQQHVRRIFVQLVRPGQGTEDTRRLATKAELREADWSLVQHLANARLVVTSLDPTQQQETVEVVHEALIRHWGQLRQWMEADREFRVWQDRLRGSLQQWESSQRDEGALLRGAPLAEAEEWLEKRRKDLSEAEQGLIEASASLREREAHEKEARQHRELKRERKVRKIALIGAGLMAGLVFFSGLKMREAEIQQVETSIALSAADSSSLKADIESIRAVRILKKSFWQKILPNIHLKASALEQLRQASLTGREQTRLEGHSQPIEDLKISPSSQYIATSSGDGSAILWNLEGEQLAVLKHLTESSSLKSLRDVVFSPNEQYLATSGHDGTARLWNLEGEQLALLEGHNGTIWDVKFSPNGQYLATAGEDGTARLWNLEGEQLALLEGHKGFVQDVTFSPDGQYLATNGHDGTARLWNFEGEQLALLEGYNGPIWDAKFSPNGKHIATAGDDGTARLWNLEGEQLALLEGHNGPIWDVAFSPNGQYIATSGDDGTARLWNLEGEQLALLEGHKGTVSEVVFHPDGQHLATGGDDGTARLWNLEGEQLALLEGHNGFVMHVVFHPDGQYLATSGEDGTARLWNLEDRKLPTFEARSGFVRNVLFSPDGHYIVTLGEDGTARLWNLEGEQLALLEGHNGPIWDVAFSPNGQYLATSGDDGTARLWNLEGEQLALLEGHSDVDRVVFSPDGQYLTTSGYDGTARLWDLEGEQLALFKGHKGSVFDVVFHPDGQRLATIGEDGTARLWDLEGKQLVVLEGHSEPIWGINFSPDGQYLATRGEDNTARLWNLEGKQIKLIRGYRGPITNVTFSPDGKKLAVSEFERIRLFTIKGRQLDVLKGHGGFVHAVEFSPDGQQLVSFGDDSTVRLWSSKGDPLAVFEGHSRTVLSAAFSPDGRQIASGGTDGRVRLWNIERSDTLLARQCDRVRNYLENSASLDRHDRHLCKGVAPAFKSLSSFAPSLETFLEAAPLPTSADSAFSDAVTKALEAAQLAQTATSPDKWNAVASHWRQAADLMNTVPNTDSNYTVAQQKVGEYQQNSQIAQQQATASATTP